MTSNLDNEYFITYSNYFKIDNKMFSFRKKVLFDITSLPIKLELKNNNNCLGYWINRKWYSLSRIKDLVKVDNVKKDISILQWNEQIHLDYVFNI
jgi:hypothetical protein